jgi:competence/damage-inducible protein CinA-like protein
MPVAEIIAIGTELLLGEVLDTNTASIARRFRDLGIDLYRTTIVGDNIERIASALKEAMQRSDIILTTGGLGPTVDDPTRQAVARAIDAELEYRPELWEQIQERFARYNRQPTENNRRQAFIPQGSVVLENPVGSAPAFYMDLGRNMIISLPGVPREMEALMEQKVIPLLRRRFPLDQIIKIHVLHCAGVGESQVDEWIADFETCANPTVGLLAHAGRVDIRIAAKASSEEEAEYMIAEVAVKIRERVGAAIYGMDAESLEGVLRQRLDARGWTLAGLECGLDGKLLDALQIAGASPEHTRSINEPKPLSDFYRLVREFQEECRADAALGALYSPGAVRQLLNLFLITPQEEFEISRSYGGPPELGVAWAVNTTLDFIRRNIHPA